MDSNIDLEALHYYLSYKYVPSPHTIYYGKRKRPLFDGSQLSFSPAHKLSENELIDELDTLLQQAVRNTLTDVPALFLSGGIDSALLAAVAARQTDRPLRTFNLVFSPEIETEKKRMDKEYARQLSVWLGTEHTEGMFTLDAFQSELPAILKAIGEPYACNMSMHFICRFAKEYVNAALAGDWADELFGSYDDHQRAALHPDESPTQIRYDASIFNDEEKQQLYATGVREKARSFSTYKNLEGYFRNLTAKDPVNRMLEGWFRSVFPDNTLMPVVKLSQAQGMDVRAPYADPQLVDFVNKIPGHFKIREGETKYIMKRLALRYLPEKFVFREKEYFTPPLLAIAQHSETFIRSLLDSEHLDKHGFFSPDYVQGLVDDFYRNPTELQSYKLWILVAFQVWYDNQDSKKASKAEQAELFV